MTEPWQEAIEKLKAQLDWRVGPDKVPMCQWVVLNRDLVEALLRQVERWRSEIHKSAIDD